jgi:hypothetical protein
MDNDFGEFFATFYRKQYEELVEKMNKRGTRFRIFARILQSSILVLAALTPVLIASSAFEQSISDVVARALRIFAIVTSSLTAIIAGVGRIFRPEEAYINARTIRNALWREHSLYKAGLHDYGASGNRDSLFVEKVTSLLDAYNAKQNKMMQESSSVAAAVAVRANPGHVAE